MSETFNSAEYKLYGRQMILPELGMVGQEKLKKSHVLVVGAGGLGAPALLYLAGAGIGTITVLDDDAVELSNLHRQVIHTFAEVGNSKAESAATSMRSLNPFVVVRALKSRLVSSNAHELLADIDVVIDGSDNFETRYVISDAAAEAGIPHVWGAILGFDAQMSVFWAGQGPVYEDLYPVVPQPGSIPTCSTAGVIGAMAGVVGTSMAMETIKLLTGVGSPLLGEVGYYSALDGHWEYVPLKAKSQEDHAPTTDQQDAVLSPNHQLVTKRNIDTRVGPQPGSPVSSGVNECTYREFEQMKKHEKVLLVDIREPAEYRALTIPGARNFPLSLIEDLSQKGTLNAHLLEENYFAYQAIVVFCSAGPRSDYAAKLLARAGVPRVLHLVEGVGGWLGFTA